MSGPHNLSVDELLALLGDPSLKPDSIAEEMECAGVPRPQPKDVERARDLLGKLPAEGLDAKAVASEIASLPEMIALALLHAAGRASRQEVLRDLAGAPQRNLAKESKRELQRLKHKRVRAQAIRPPGEAGPRRR